jgi:hypothetical protein
MMVKNNLKVHKSVVAEEGAYNVQVFILLGQKLHTDIWVFYV